MPVKRARTTSRFTIERLRTTVLIGGGLLVAAIGIFLGLGQWRLYRQIRDLPKRLGIDIQQQADGVNYTQSRKGKTLFRIHAARAIQMKTSGKMLLHDVRIDLYGDDGSRTDTISGGEFEYDHQSGIAQATGPVEIVVMRPDVKPSITQLEPGTAKSAVPPQAGKKSPATVDHPAEGQAREIHVKTSGLTFDQKSGLASTIQRVDFALQQGSGSSTGATYNSSQGQLILDHDVELHVERSGSPVTIHASHADFERAQELCQMTTARAEYTGGSVQTANALMHFREDGSVVRLDGSGGVDVLTKTGSHVTAPRGNVEFDEQNHPTHGLLEGGAKLEMTQPARQIQGSSPTVRLQFTGEGQLRQAHMEQGVFFTSHQQGISAKGLPSQINRTWKSQVADVTFVPTPNEPPNRTDAAQGDASSQVEPQTVQGTGNVIVTSETNIQASGVNTRDSSTLAADSVVAKLAPGGALTSLVGDGHAHFVQDTPEGAHQSSTSDQLDVHFVPGPPGMSRPPSRAKIPQVPSHNSSSQQAFQASSQISSQIASITQIGNVLFEQNPPAKLSKSSAPNQAAPAKPLNNQQPIRATASRADYDGSTQVLHLTGSPHVHNGELDMTATVMDFARTTGDAFAHGNVKASWANSGNESSKDTPLPGATLLASGQYSAGGPAKASLSNIPIHAIADEAEIHQSTQEITFRAAPKPSAATSGKTNQPRLWQAANSVSAPLIVLNRQKQTLTAQSTELSNPVRTVLVSSSAGPSTRLAGAAGKVKQNLVSVIRVRSGDLHYSEGERLALCHAGALGTVTAETSDSNGTSTVSALEAEIKLLPPGIHPAPKQSNNSRDPDASVTPSNSSIDQLTALGNVHVDWPDRKGTGEKLVYMAEQGTFTLTGTSAAPPRITDEVRGTVTGSALIFHTGDDSVTVEGDGGKTQTETQSPKKQRKLP